MYPASVVAKRRKIRQPDRLLKASRKRTGDILPQYEVFAKDTHECRILL